MKRWLIILAFLFLRLTPVDAQKINLEKWVSHTVDSLRKHRVDTIEYYHEYCGGCEIIRKPTDTIPLHQCETEYSWVQAKNDIIYGQNGKYYLLMFNCGYPPIKREVQIVKSLEYFVSIIPDLDERDKYWAEKRKEHKFAPPITIDGVYEEAILYIGHFKQRVFMQGDQKKDKNWLSFFWMDKQIKLLELLESEISSKN